MAQAQKDRYPHSVDGQTGTSGLGFLPGAMCPGGGTAAVSTQLSYPPSMTTWILPLWAFIVWPGLKSQTFLFTRRSFIPYQKATGPIS